VSVLLILSGAGNHTWDLPKTTFAQQDTITTLAKAKVVISVSHRYCEFYDEAQVVVIKNDPQIDGPLVLVGDEIIEHANGCLVAIFAVLDSIKTGGEVTDDEMRMIFRVASALVNSDAVFATYLENKLTDWITP